MKHLSRSLALVAALLLAGCQSQTVTPADKTAFLTAADLGNFGYPKPTVPVESWSKTAYADGSLDIEYEAETPDSEQTDPLYLTETLSRETSSKEARSTLATTRGAMNLVLKTQKLTETTMPNQTIYGDGSSLTILKLDGTTPVGNIFSARQGKRTYTIMVTGFYFDDPVEWDAFAGAKIRAWLSQK